MLKKEIAQNKSSTQSFRAGHARPGIIILDHVENVEFRRLANVTHGDSAACGVVILMAQSGSMTTPHGMTNPYAFTKPCVHGARKG